jgi:polyhydroxyalkanoate synthesis repressor PhaR
MSESDKVSTDESTQPTPVVVKKYANRRLYNTESSSYITLDSLATMIRVGRDFVVYDAKSGEDITRGVLTQIIVEEESKGRAMLPTAFLRQIIGFYGDSLQQFVPGYLESAMSNFALQQEQMRTAMQQTMGTFFPPGMQEVGRQNMAMMERAMSLFAPFYRTPESGRHRPANEDAQAKPDAGPQNGEMDALRDEVALLRSQLAAARAAAVAQPAREPEPELAPAKKPPAKVQ